jgi:hypothetical protein
MICCNAQSLEYNNEGRDQTQSRECRTEQLLPRLLLQLPPTIRAPLCAVDENVT